MSRSGEETMAIRKCAFERTRGGAAALVITIGTAVASAVALDTAAAETRESLEVDVGACVELDSPEERFACYERSVEAARRGQGDSEPASAEPSRSAGASVSVSRPPAAVGASPSSRAANEAAVVEREIPLRAESDFGMRPARQREETERQELRSTIAALRETVPNTFLITLENGQVWRQMEAKRYRLEIGDSVRVYPSRSGGSYRLSVEGINGFIQVERVR